MDKIDKAINDAKLHEKEAMKMIREWTIRHEERMRFKNTLDIIKAEKND